MRNFATIPFHDLLAERLLIRNPNEAALFEVRITDQNGTHFSHHNPYGRNIGEYANIRANDYPDQNYKRVFMFLDNRCPTWPEMVKLKSMFFHSGETVIQFHPESTQYVNEKTTALHLWEPKDEEQIRNLKKAAKLISATTKKFQSSKIKHGVLAGSTQGKKFVVIFCGETWATWEEVCDIKQQYFGTGKTAFQINISEDFDLHPSKVLTLWDAEEFGIKLPPADIV